MRMKRSAFLTGSNGVEAAATDGTLGDEGEKLRSGRKQWIESFVKAADFIRRMIGSPMTIEAVARLLKCLQRRVRQTVASHRRKIALQYWWAEWVPARGRPCFGIAEPSRPYH